MKKTSTLLFFAVALSAVSFTSFCQPKDSAPSAAQQSVSAANAPSSEGYVPFSGPSAPVEQVNAPPPPVETPISGIELLLGGGLLMGIRKSRKFFARNK
jgi:hypothetical protein